MPKSVIAGSYGKYTFKMIRNCQTFFQSVCTILHSHQWYMSDTVFPYPHQVLSLIFNCSNSSVGKESACSAGDPGSIPGLGRSPGEGNSYSLQYSGLENSMDCVVHGVAKSQTRLSNFQFHKAGREGKRGKHVSSGISF